MKLPGQLSKLNEDQYRVMVDMLAMGKSDGEITDALIADTDHFGAVKRETLLRSVNRWRKNGTAQDAIIKMVADLMQDSRGNIKRQVDVFEELTALIMKQKSRLQVVYTQEAGKPLLLGSVTAEMKFMTDLLEKMGRLQLDAGLIRRVRVGETADDYAHFEEVEDTGPVAFTMEEQKLLSVLREEVGIEE